MYKVGIWTDTPNISTRTTILLYIFQVHMKRFHILKTLLKFPLYKYNQHKKPIIYNDTIKLMQSFFKT